MTSVDFEGLPPKERYKLLVATVVPRPVALVTTVSPGGVVNAAPFAFFNAVCGDPPAVFVAVNNEPDEREKDTAVNIRATGEFVVNMVSEAIAPLMNLCETALPSSVSEPQSVGLETTACVRVSPPRIVASPISIECRLLQTVSLGVGKAMFIGEVVYMHFADGLHDSEHNYVRTELAGIVGRMHGGGTYTRTTDLFVMPRLSAEEKRSRFGALLETQEPLPPGSDIERAANRPSG